ncbi:MAG: ribosome small subunit-dependent GTPase A [Eubacteriales bacterium]|nr:ribosome small subunit-dependent GTPase A [Eubacteriales bacterium]
MEGKIIKAIAGFYYIHAGAAGIYACRARGIFRKDGIKPLVGDNAAFEVLSEEKKEGNLTEVLPRKNMLIRPAAANIDQALVIFALREPDPNLNLLDRFLIYMGMQQIPVIIYFNKDDLDRNKTAEKYRAVYEAAGYTLIFGSVKEGNADAVRKQLRGKTTVLAGPSGVGKSSLTNLLHAEERMEVGALSERIKRGKQTTRHTELFMLEENTYLLDTPGFTSLSLPGLPAAEVKEFFPEFSEYAGECKFAGCLHIQEQEGICGVKRALSKGLIRQERYENYLQIYEEQKKAERRY